MLELRPNCEHCNRLLKPNTTEAMICSFECTFCKTCVEKILHNVCPNCGGGFCPRPTRPINNLKNNNYLGKFPASVKIVLKQVDTDVHDLFSRNIKNILANDR